ncbi:MAG: protoheme IX farnesyltransferase [Acidobacteriota bacterium]
MRDLMILTKVPIAATSTLSALSVYLLAGGGGGMGLAFLFAGVCLAAMGASALNEWQERDLDALMERTRRRPIPAGRISQSAALLLAVALVAAGLVLTWEVFGVLPAFLCLGAVFWYNAVYTPLKRLSAFAVVPGSVIGAIPPAIGWTAAGADLLDARLASLCFFFFLWQVPHFWLLLYRYGEEYERAGYPSLQKLLGKRGLARLTFVWLATAAASVLLLPLFGAVLSPASVWILGVAAMALTAGSLPLLGDRPAPRVFRAAFAAVNLFALLVMAALAAEPYWPGSLSVALR